MSSGTIKRNSYTKITSTGISGVTAKLFDDGLIVLNIKASTKTGTEKTWVDIGTITDARLIPSSLTTFLGLDYNTNVSSKVPLVMQLSTNGVLKAYLATGITSVLPYGTAVYTNT